MSDKILQEYINRQISKGIDLADLRKVLLDAGWIKSDIELAINLSSLSKLNLSKSTENKPVGLSDEDVFINSEGVKKRRFSKKFLYGIFFLLLILLISGGSVWAYFNIYLAPEKIFYRSLLKMQTIGSSKFSGKFKIFYQDSSINTLENDSSNQNNNLFLSSKPGNYLLSFEGGSEMVNTINSKFYLNTQANINDTPFTSFEIKIINRILYLNILDLEDFGYFDKNLITNRWIKFDLQELTKDYYQKGSSETNDFTLTENEKNELWEIAKKNPPYQLIEKINDEKINDITAFHLRYRVSKENLKRLVSRYLELLTDDAIDERGKADFENFFSKIEFGNNEIWIGKKDQYIYKTIMDLNFKEDEKKVLLNFEISLFDYNQPVTIEIPQDFNTIQEIFNQIFGEINPLNQGQANPLSSPETLIPYQDSDFSQDLNYQDLINLNQEETSTESSE